MEQRAGSLCELQVLSLGPRELEGDPEGVGGQLQLPQGPKQVTQAKRPYTGYLHSSWLLIPEQPDADGIRSRGVIISSPNSHAMCVIRPSHL